MLFPFTFHCQPCHWIARLHLLQLPQLEAGITVTACGSQRTGRGSDRSGPVPYYLLNILNIAPARSFCRSPTSRPTPDTGLDGGRKSSCNFYLPSVGLRIKLFSLGWYPRVQPQLRGWAVVLRRGGCVLRRCVCLPSFTEEMLSWKRVTTQ